MKRYLSLIASLFLFCFSLTILFLSMRAVLNVGGACAEGGAYEIAQHCPGGTAWLTPLSVWVGVGAALWYFYARSKFQDGPHWGYFFWSALFLSLGYNFLEFGLFPKSDASKDIGFIICGVLFWLMGGGPIALVASVVPADLFGLKDMLIGKTERSLPLFVLHLLCLGAGVLLGRMVFHFT